MCAPGFTAQDAISGVVHFRMLQAHRAHAPTDRQSRNHTIRESPFTFVVLQRREAVGRASRGRASRRVASSAFLKRFQDAFNRTTESPIDKVQTVSIGSIDRVSKMGLGAASRLCQNHTSSASIRAPIRAACAHHQRGATHIVLCNAQSESADHEHPVRIPATPPCKTVPW